MIELFSLIEGLHSDEGKVVCNSLKKNISDDDVSLINKLYLIIASAKGELIADHILSVMIYGSVQTAALSKLKSRLFRFILDAITSDSALTNPSLFEDVDSKIIGIRRRMIQFRILYRKKSRIGNTLLNHLLRNIIKDAKAFELYDILVEATHFKKTMCFSTKGFEGIDEIEKQADLYMYSYRAILNSNTYYFELITNQSLQYRVKPRLMKAMLRRAISEMNEYIVRTNSASIKYYCRLLQLDLLLTEGKYAEAQKTCKEILRLLKNHRHLYRDERLGSAYANLSICEVYGGNVNASVRSAQRSLDFYFPGSFNYVLSVEQEFSACYYGGLYKQAYIIVKQLLEVSVTNIGEFRHDKYKLFQAATLLKLKRFKEALSICSQTLELSKDKCRWDLGLRYIRLMTLIEMKFYDTAYLEIENLRKVMERHPENTDNGRDEIIYLAFRELASSGFDCLPTKKLIKHLEKLSAKGHSWSWNYYTHELIPVNEWMKLKFVAKQNIVRLVLILSVNFFSECWVFDFL